MPDLAAPAAMPAAPAAPSTPAAPAAPATPAPAAPVTPAAEPAAAPVTPAPGSEGGAAEAAAAAAPAAAGKPEPKAADYGDDIEKFLKDHNAWEREQEGGAAATDDHIEAESAEAATEAEKKEEEAQPEAEKAQDDQEQEFSLEEAPDLTPESLNSLIKETPELGALLEANPKLNGAFQKMARTNAKAAPMLEMFPTVQSAKFAHETSNQLVGMRTAFQMAIEEPEKISDAFELFLDEFKIKGADGNYLTEADGTPKLAPDFDLLSTHMTDLRLAGAIADIESRLQANQYANEDAKDNDAAALQAYKFIQAYEKQSGDEASRPDLSNLDPAARKYFEDKERELEEREKALGNQKRQQTKEERKAERKTYDDNFKRQYGGAVGKFLGDEITKLKARGVHIPSYVLEMKDAKTGASIFAVNVFNKFKTLIDGVADYKRQAAELQMLPPSDDSLKQRLEFFRGLMNDHLPSIIRQEIKAAQGKDRADREARGADRTEAQKVAVTEARGGGIHRAQPMTEEQAMAEAYKQVDAEAEKSGKFLSGMDRMEKALNRKNQLLRGGGR